MGRLDRAAFATRIRTGAVARVAHESLHLVGVERRDRLCHGRRLNRAHRFGALLDAWLERAIRGRRPARTYQLYALTVRKHLRPYIGAVGLTEIEPSHVVALHDEWIARGTGGRTCVLAQTNLSQVMMWAKQMRWLEHNPLEGIPRPPHRTRDAPGALGPSTRTTSGGRGALAGAWLVFASAVGTLIQPDNLLRAHHARVVQAGVTPIRFHDLRHTCATLALTGDDVGEADLKVIGESIRRIAPFGAILLMIMVGARGFEPPTF